MIPILEIKNLSVEFYKKSKVIPALRDISLNINKGETLGIVGESGCGKSTLALSILKLISPHDGKITSGQIIFEDRDLLDMSNHHLQKIRGGKISMIFQDPFTSLNPVLTIGMQIEEVIKAHNIANTRNNIRDIALQVLKQARMPRPEEIISDYPHQLSGGMLQRAMIAMAIASRPEILIADEPTTALDVTIQKEILDLLALLQDELQMTIILITHNLGIISQITKKVCVMYAGKIIEEASVNDLFTSTLHPYTKGLLSSVPKINDRRTRLFNIPGQIPDPSQLPAGCKFNPRCSYRTDICLANEPELEEIKPNHWVRCYHAKDIRS